MKTLLKIFIYSFIVLAIIGFTRDRVDTTSTSTSTKSTVKHYKKAPAWGNKWKIHQETSALDDSNNVTVYLNAQHSIRARSYKNSTPTLTISCRENKTRVYIDWGAYITTRDTKVTTRLDKKKAKKRTWSMSTNNEATFYKGKNISFTKELMNHDTLLANVTPYGENTVSATFDIRKLDEAIKPLRKSCGW